MLEDVFPDTNRFRLCRNEHRGLGISISELVRRQGLLKAFATRQELRKAIGTGEVWTIRSNAVQAASSFVDLLRHVGRYIPTRFNGVAPPLPRADYGLVLSYDSALSRPWCLEYRTESRSALTNLRGLTFRAVLQRSLDLECERTRATAEAFAAMERDPIPLAVRH